MEDVKEATAKREVWSGVHGLLRVPAVMKHGPRGYT